MWQKRHTTAQLGMLSLASFITIAVCQNIDVDSPISREVSGLASRDLFGYSLVLHQTNANPTTMAEALQGVK